MHPLIFGACKGFQISDELDYLNLLLAKFVVKKRQDKEKYDRGIMFLGMLANSLTLTLVVLLIT